MVQETTQYYEQMLSVVPQALQLKWEAEITLAESQRLSKPSAMDIIGVRHTQAVGRSDPSPVGSTGENVEWLDLALSIEERQYVVLIVIVV